MGRAVTIQVLGGGALGLSAALALADDGHDVILHERGTLGCESTGKAAGILSTMTAHDDDYQLIATTRGRIGELISLAAGAVPEARSAWKPVDSITVAKGEKLAVLDDFQQRLERNTEEPERLDHRQASQEFPQLHFEPGEEILVAQEDGCIEAGDWLAAMRWRLDAEGVEVRENSAGDLNGPTVVARGAWTAPLLARHGIQLPVASFRTQLASLALPEHEVPIVHDAVRGFYMRPESNDTFMAGNGTVLEPHDADDYDEAADPQFRASIAERVVGRVHGADGATIRSAWAGLCVATPDTRPLCGPVPDHDDLWVLTGDNGFGLMRSMALGERLAAAVDGDVHPETDPRRFQDVGAWEMREGFGF